MAKKKSFLGIGLFAIQSLFHSRLPTRVACMIVCLSLVISLTAAPPRIGYRHSEIGREIVSVPVDPFMTSDEEQRLLDILRRPSNAEFHNRTLREVCEALSKFLPTELNVRACEDLGIPVDSPLMKIEPVEGQTLGARLYAVLDQYDLDLLIKGGRLVVTTTDDAEDPRQAVVRVYDVTPLVSSVDDTGERRVSFDRLAETIQSQIQPDTWETLGGPSAISGQVIRDRAYLVCSTTTRVHLQIQSLLDALNRPDNGDQRSWTYSRR